MDFGDQRLKLAVDPLTADQKPLPAAVRRRLGADLKRLAGEKRSLVRVVAAPGDGADWVLRLDSLRSGKVFLVPASGWTRPGTKARARDKGVGPFPPLFGPAPPGDGAVPWLRDRLRRIARVRNLIALAVAHEGKLARSDKGPSIEVELVRFRNEKDQEGVPVRRGDAVPVLHVGDQIGFRVSNRGQEAVDVTLLSIGSNYGIEPVFPRGVSVDARREPGEPPLQIGPVPVKGTTVGLEHLIAIAVKSRDVDLPANFCFLAQPSIEQLRRTANRGTRPGLDSPLGLLFQSALYGEKKTRGADAASINEVSFVLLSWTVPPAKKTARSR